MTTPPPDANAPASFEDAIRKLGEIVAKLEEGELSLEASLAAFEQGVGLARQAQSRLDAAEARVEELLSVEEGGKAVTRPIAGRKGGADFDDE
jgi:exodeoxyribonuclease VII small subunit